MGPYLINLYQCKNFFLPILPPFIVISNFADFIHLYNIEFLIDVCFCVHKHIWLSLSQCVCLIVSSFSIYLFIFQSLIFLRSKLCVTGVDFVVTSSGVLCPRVSNVKTAASRPTSSAVVKSPMIAALTLKIYRVSVSWLLRLNLKHGRTSFQVYVFLDCKGKW